MPMDPRLDATPFQTATVTALRYHTTGDTHDVVHLEGDEYQVDDPELLRTLIACQFVDFKEPYVEPPPP